ncbi:hypothetical protein ATO13_14515 [Stappia sp. 22II-S9-Z10]|nr:hypothetical protein ATO13_14515 [Stappia sp. 22II-S9-Z10]
METLVDDQSPFGSLPPKRSISALESLGRVRLSRYLSMRQCLYSEIAATYGILNVPDNRDLAIANGTALATTLLDPLFETFGVVEIRSAYRSPLVNAIGNRNDHNCAANDFNHGRHIWDRLDVNGHRGATACVHVPWFAAQLPDRDWRDFAWWLYDHLEGFDAVSFLSTGTFNIRWCEAPVPSLSAQYGDVPRVLLRAGSEPGESLEARRARYADFPSFRGLSFP